MQHSDYKYCVCIDDVTFGSKMSYFIKTKSYKYYFDGNRYFIKYKEDDEMSYYFYPENFKSHFSEIEHRNKIISEICGNTFV